MGEGPLTGLNLHFPCKLVTVESFFTYVLETAIF